MAEPKYTTVTPVLSTKAGYVSDVRDQIATLLRFVIMNPGWISSIWDELLISFRTMSSKYEHDRTELSSNLQLRINETLKRMFADYNFDCEFTTEDLDPSKKEGDSQYTIKFSIMMTAPGESIQESALVTGSIEVDEKTNDIVVNYDRNQDTNFMV